MVGCAIPGCDENGMDYSTCISCAIGYSLNETSGLCQYCGNTGCWDCNLDGQCLTCMDSAPASSLQHLSCSLIPDQCYAYNSTLGVCTKCAEGFNLDPNGPGCGVCDSIDPICAHCDMGDCIACAAGTLLGDNSGCTDPISNCFGYTDRTL